jgi:tetratricopeptide (TPR) repeat protein
MRPRWCALLLLARPLAAQVPAGDSAWVAGDFARARTAYQLALHDNPGSVRALYRLGVLASWDGQLDSSLALLRDAREIEPRDPDVRIQEARVLAWAGRYQAAIVRWDSLLAEFPDRRDAALGRAQTLAWAGRLDAADSAYGALVAQDSSDVDALAGQAQVASWRGDFLNAIRYYRLALERDPKHVASLVGLAQVRQWQGRPAEARPLVDRALAIAPSDRTALEVRAAIHAMVRPQMDLTIGWSHDSDRNTLWWENLGTSIALGPGVRGFARVGLAQATDPVRSGSRATGEVGGSYDIGSLGLSAALGGRRLSSDAASDRTLATWRAGASYRITPSAGMGVGYAHYSIDETAQLLGRNLDLDELTFDGDAELRPGLSLSLGGSIGWFSDHNSRRAAVVAVNQRVARGLTAGVLFRTLSYDTKGVGYFSPDRFHVGEARATYVYGIRKWEGRLSGGLGVQQVGSAGSGQSQWHLEARVARRWAVLDEVALSGGISNSAESSTTGAFRYYTAALSLRLGL